MWEVSIINKQKFLAELAKLLTFMYEDDRQLALGAYNEMFEEAEDEQMLLQALVSPLRQAVEVARAYNAGKPGLSAESRQGESEDTEKAFLDAIYRIRAEALSTQPVREAVDEDQISLFDAPEEAPAEEAETAAEEAPAAEESVEATEEAPETDETEEAQPAAPAEEAEPKAEVKPEVKAIELQPEAPARLPVEKTVRKPRVLLLILYILLAVPLGLIGFILLLVPALASLAAAIACIVVGVLAITSALGSFPKIANLLVALGAALILLAVGLVFLMLFVWFLGGAIGGMIRGLIHLGGKWCYKEVPAK